MARLRGEMWGEMREFVIGKSQSRTNSEHHVQKPLAQTLNGGGSSGIFIRSTFPLSRTRPQHIVRLRVPRRKQEEHCIVPLRHLWYHIIMARGNQRDKAREKNLAKLASQVKSSLLLKSMPRFMLDQCADDDTTQKSKSGLSGTEQQKDKENVAAIMRAKQAAGES